MAAGIEHITDGKPQKKDVLQFIGRTVQLEQRNQAMNCFIGVTVEKMREAGIYTLLVKEQGVAQCYERPLWRACGDVDFFPGRRELRAGEGVPEASCSVGGGGVCAGEAPRDDHRPVGGGAAREAVQRSVGEDRAGAG